MVRARSGAADREVVGLVAAGLAFGSATTIVASAERAAGVLGATPAAALHGMSDGTLRRRLRGFRHRWIDGDDVAASLAAVRDLRRRHGSLEGAFVAGDPGGRDVGPALAALAAELESAQPTFARRGVAGLVPSPASGSACKRPLLWLRWMVRPGPVDTGAWTRVSPARLLLPLDTHTARITRALGLLRRRATDWRAALEVTAALRRYDRNDPVRYDFALCRLGILRHWPAPGSGTVSSRQPPPCGS